MRPAYCEKHMAWVKRAGRAGTADEAIHLNQKAEEDFRFVPSKQKFIFPGTFLVSFSVKGI